MAKFQFPGDLTLVVSDRSEEFASLDTGASFPTWSKVVAQLGTRALIELSLSVEDGQLVLTRCAFERAPGASPLSASFVHELPIGEIVDRVIGAVAVTAYLNVESADTGRGVFGAPWSELHGAATRAVSSQRGRPVADDALRRVGKILVENKFDYREQVKRELHVSDRTASRWIAAAKKRGFDKIGDDK